MKIHKLLLEEVQDKILKDHIGANPLHLAANHDYFATWNFLVDKLRTKIQRREFRVVGGRVTGGHPVVQIFIILE